MGLIGVIDQDHVVGAMNGRIGLCAIPFMSAADPNPGRCSSTGLCSVAHQGPGDHLGGAQFKVYGGVRG